MPQTLMNSNVILIGNNLTYWASVVNLPWARLLMLALIFNGYANAWKTKHVKKKIYINWTWTLCLMLPKNLMAQIEGCPCTHLKNIHIVFTFYVLEFLFYTHTHLLCPTKDSNIVFANLFTNIARRNFSILPLVEFAEQPIEVNFNFWHTPWQPCSQKFPK